MKHTMPIAVLALSLGVCTSVSWAADTVVSASPSPAATEMGCTRVPCVSPSQVQMEALFSKIEKLYPSIFSSASGTLYQAIAGDAVWYRFYPNPNPNTPSAGLASYQGGLWYAINGRWLRFGTLDQADQQFCRSTCFVSANNGTQGTTPAFNMSQTLSDGAQRTTLAFSGLALMTGNLEAQSFFPPGKVADYTGFQYLRDNDPDRMGHNTSFLTRIANNVIYLLNDTQFAQLKTLASGQLELINQYGYQRYPLMKAFRRLLEGDVPTGSSGLNLNAVKKASRELYLIDGQISVDRAVLYANIIKSLDSTQKAYLDGMKGKGWNSWPDVSNEQIRTKMQGLPQGTSVAVMTYASDLFSWYAGSLEADVYFCPERHGTYYGGFYIKDAPAIGHEGYSIDEQLTATAGAALSDAAKGYVNAQQATTMANLVSTQKDNLNGIVKVRTEIASLLRSLIGNTAAIDAVKARVLELSATYGELDGANNYDYASTFANVYKSLSAAQKAQLFTLRQSIMSGTYADGTKFDFSVATTPFLYSSIIKDMNLLNPYLSNTDYLFFEPK